jgi:hypothetical protein
MQVRPFSVGVTQGQARPDSELSQQMVVMVVAQRRPEHDIPIFQSKHLSELTYCVKPTLERKLFMAARLEDGYGWLRNDTGCWVSVGDMGDLPANCANSTGADFPCSVKQQERACQAVRPQMPERQRRSPTEMLGVRYCANRNRPDVIWHLTRSVPTNGHTVNRMTCMAPPATGGC